MQVHTEFYTQSDSAWEAMLADIDRAEKTVDMEQYIFAADRIGLRFIELFQKKAKEGVKIRLLCDTAGSVSFYRSALPGALRDQGIDVRFFNEINPARINNFTSNLFRDHRKILVVDGSVAHVGGVGVQEHMALWRDTNMRLVGPIIPVIGQSFEDAWAGSTRGFRIKYTTPVAEIDKFTFLTNSPSLKQRHIFHVLKEKIKASEKYIYLNTPYFIPDFGLARVLRRAAKRGVDIRLIVPRIADHLFINHARESYFTRAMKSGIKIYFYEPKMMHAKTAIIDDTWATAGSFNLDNLSFFFNHEANIASSDSIFIKELRDQFFRDLGSCKEIKYEEWIKRPLSKKFLELITWPFHGML